MKEYYYNDDDIELFRFLLNNKPQQIWWEVIYYVFQYDNFHIVGEIYSVVGIASESNNYTYAMSVKFSKRPGVHKTSEIARLLCENEYITEIRIARTKVCWGKFHEPSIDEFDKIQSVVASVTGPENVSPEAKMKELSRRYYNIMHPDAPVPDNCHSDMIYCYDAGLLVILGDKFIKVFVDDNDDDFDNYYEEYIFDNFELVDKLENFQFYPVK